MSSKLKRLLSVLLIAVLAMLAVIFVLLRKDISFVDGDTVIRQKAFVGSSLTFPAENCPDGFIFTGWQDEDGVMHTEPGIIVFGSGSYTAQYELLIERGAHEAFIFSQDDGFFHLDESMSRGELIRILYGFISAEAEVTDAFSDMDESDVLYEPACVFKSLGIISEEMLLPEAAVTGEELAEILGFFHTDNSYSGEAVPSGELSRLQVIEQLCLACGCSGPAEVPSGLRGAVPDLAPEDERYGFALEAAVSHGGNGSQCDWSSYDEVISFEPGFFTVGNVLYYAHEDGSLARNESIGGLDFGEDGRFTTGMSELDILITDILDGLITEEMSSLDKLEAAYYYVLDNSKYLKGNLYDRGESGWAEDEAYSMLSSGYGNCYGYAAAFYELARAIGYDARVYSGNMGADYDPHGWVEIEIDGVNYYFDPQLEMSYRLRHEYDSLFMVNEEFARKWSYVH